MPSLLRTALPPLAAALTVAALAACGQPTPSTPDDDATVSVPIQPTLTPEPETPTSTAAPSDAGDGGLFDASSSFTGVTCAPGADQQWTMTGTLRNPDTQKHVFTVAVFVTTPGSGDEVASEEVDVPLAAGASTRVSIPRFWSGPKAGHECITGVTVKDD